MGNTYIDIRGLLAIVFLFFYRIISWINVIGLILL